MWERTLQDLVRGLRANKKEESRFISRAIDEIREEIKKKDMDLKAAAVLKLVYLEMLGYDMRWAAFYVVEVMSSPKSHIKSVGYLAATQSFHQDTDVLTLTTNLLRKDLSSNPHDVAAALDGLSNFVTPDLARDVSADMFAMLNHSRAHVRKRAVLTLFKVFLKYPETLEQNYGRLQEKLEDPDPGVVSATVNVLCELARIDPKPYLPLAPMLFHLLTNSSNNWMLIKLIKLFGYLTPVEPRLVKKLQPPVSDLISTTPAISLLYECVRTCITGGMLTGASGRALADACVRKLASFLQDSDQNLKYISLLALVKIVPYYPNLAAEYQDLILTGMDDTDISIRMRSLELLSAMVDRTNIQSIVQHLLTHLLKSQSATPQVESAAHALAKTVSGTSTGVSGPSPGLTPSYRLAVANSVIEMCHTTGHENPEWLLSVYVDLTYVARANVGQSIKECILDIVLRRPASRQHAVKLMNKLLDDDVFLLNANEPGSCAEVLSAAAWVCGEYATYLQDPRQVLDRMFQPSMERLQPEIIVSYLQASLKIFGFWAASFADSWTDNALTTLQSMVVHLLEAVEGYTLHSDVEVRERACNSIQLWTFVKMDIKSFGSSPLKRDSTETAEGDPKSASGPEYPKSLYLVEPLVSAYPLQAQTHQSEIPICPLDLNQWIIPSMKPIPQELVVTESPAATVIKSKPKSKSKPKVKRNEMASLVPDSGLGDEAPGTSRRHRVKGTDHEDNPFYLKTEAKMDDIDSIPVLHLEESMPKDEEESETPPGPLEPANNAGSQVSPTNGNPWDESTGRSDQIQDEPERSEFSPLPEPLKVTRVKKKKKSSKVPKQSGTEPPER